MSADLPDCSAYDSSMAMARVLVSYMDNADAVRSRILEDFDKSPAVVTIERLRREYLAAPTQPEEEPFKPYEGYYPAEVAEAAAEASVEFLRRLERERALSVELARSQGALHSPLLVNPSLVDKALEKEITKARGEFGL